MFEQRHVNLTGDPLTASLATRISARRNSSCPVVVTKNTVFDQPTRYVSVNLRLSTEAEEELPMWLKDFCTFSVGFRYDFFAMGLAKFQLSVLTCMSHFIFDIFMQQNSGCGIY